MDGLLEGGSHNLLEGSDVYSCPQNHSADASHIAINLVQRGS